MAELAGLALGVVGVAGLYSVTLQVFEQISDAANFNRDLETQQAKLKAALTSLRLWGAGTGFTTDGALLPDHHAVFDDGRILYDVQSALFCIKDACSQLRSTFDKSAAGSGNDPRARVKKKIASAGKRLRWAFQEKTKVEDVLNQVICLVGLLYQIARPKDAASLESDAKLNEILSTSHEQSRRVADELIRQAKELQLSKQKDIETWLDAPRTNLVYHAALSKALPGTCQWITEDPLLRQWTTPSPSPPAASAQCVWLYSRIAGAGKTVAASKFVESLKNEPSRHVAYYFGTHETSTNHGFNGIVRSWIRQLTRCYGWEDVEVAYDASIEDDKPVDPWTILRSMLTRNTSTYLVLDGLDEVEDRNGKYTTTARSDFLRTLVATIRETATHLLIVSRYEQDIEQVFRSRNSEQEEPIMSPSEIQLEQTAIDIERVAHHQLLKMFPAWTEDQRQNIVAAVVKKADGMFVLLYAFLEQLSEGSACHDVQSSVSQPLSGHSNTDMLQQAYQSKVGQILSLPPAVRDLCLRVLLWVQQSARPLKIGELLDILQVMSRKGEDAFEIPRIQNLADLNSRLLQHCQIFLSLRSDSEHFFHRTLHLAHYSVKEFLQCTGSLENSKFRYWKLFQSGQLANSYLATACLTYLLQSDFAKYPAKPMPGASAGVYEYDEGFRDILKRKHMFYDYAASFWWKHLDLACRKPDLVAFIKSGMATTKSEVGDTNVRDMLKQVDQLEQLLEVISPGKAKGYDKFLPLDTTLQNLCLEFLGLGGDNGCCNYKIWMHYHLGLWKTANDDYLDTARDLLEYPTRMFEPDWASKPHWRVIDFYMWQSHLLSTYRNHRKLRLQSRLLEAMCMHSTALAAILVEEGADINFTWPDHRQTLEIYSAKHRTSAAPLFFHVWLTHFGASTELNKPVFPVLIPINGTVFRAGGGGWFNPRVLWGFLYGNVLQRKVLNAWRFDEPGPYDSGISDLDTIRAMIFWHIEINNRSLFHPSAVHAAVLNIQAMTENRIEMLKLLFVNGGDANIRPWLRPVATFVSDEMAVRETLWEMLSQLLPSNGVSTGRTFASLLKLLEHDDRYNFDREDLIGCLLGKDALNYNSAGWIKQEKLQLAARRGDEDEVKKLLDNGLNVNRCGPWYGSALYVAAFTGKLRIVTLLLDHNADPNIAVETRILPLELERDFRWAGLRHKFLANTDARYTPLQAASAQGHLAVVKILLDRGADVNQNEGQSGTPLYFAVRAAVPRYLAAEWALERSKGEKLQYWKDLNNKDRKKSALLIRFLVNRGADVNRPGGRYGTSLQAACVNGEAGVVVYLLKMKADPNIVGGEWGTALQAALVHHPDPDVEAVSTGTVYDPDDAPFAFPRGIRLYAIFVLLFRIFPLTDLVELATRKSPEDKALLLAYALLESGGADPTILAGPWGSAIHAAAYYGSWPALRLLLDSKYSTPTARTTAVNTPGSRLGLAINGPLISGRWDKAMLLLRDARAEYRYLPLFAFRMRNIAVSTFQRLIWVLGIYWAMHDALVVVAVVALATAVGVPVYLAWEEMDRRAREWDPRLGGLWMLFSLLAAGWVTNMRQNWSEDSAW
ncbi:hypothetical protein GE09DRAFT_1156720 [Coniochaeta sp. 2T2.1]|nr:hypothetical protein GE09DRAFT_1156720 [Coniochaeta sp. 2T2.1]